MPVQAAKLMPVACYDANGNQLIREFYLDADGTVDTRWRMTYDANGNILTGPYDYNEYGDLLTEEFYMGGDGTVDMRATSVYDRWQ